MKKPGTFTKNDPRINRKGRPKTFDALRAMAQSIASEVARVNGEPVIIDEHAATNIEMLMRKMMHENPERFIEIGFGKVPHQIDVTSKGKYIGWKDFINADAVPDSE